MSRDVNVKCSCAWFIDNRISDEPDCPVHGKNATARDQSVLAPLAPGMRWDVQIHGENTSTIPTYPVRVDITESSDAGQNRLRVAELTVSPGRLQNMREMTLRALAAAWGFEIRLEVKR